MFSSSHPARPPAAPFHSSGPFCRAFHGVELGGWRGTLVQPLFYLLQKQRGAGSSESTALCLPARGVGFLPGGGAGRWARPRGEAGSRLLPDLPAREDSALADGGHTSQHSPDTALPSPHARARAITSGDQAPDLLPAPRAAPACPAERPKASGPKESGGCASPTVPASGLCVASSPVPPAPGAAQRAGDPVGTLLRSPCPSFPQGRQTEPSAVMPPRPSQNTPCTGAPGDSGPSPQSFLFSYYLSWN